MKNTFCIALLYLCLSLLIASCCRDNDPEPACVQAEVVGPDCGGSWYLLSIPNTEEIRAGILPGGCYATDTYVTVNNLPEAYRKPGLKINVALEENNGQGPVCTAVYMMYPAASIKRICSSGDR
ncbi:hypothetical protein [Pontibacter ruber]|uniref:Uncharacterized protein n=1 Tax=Pontibacter ruber TaxID=1343895 RepID=A0ABW5CYZ8_9BACT|nr:hypothetical protein [Pontibacter ruber]